jgi:hypothetical protein
MTQDAIALEDIAFSHCPDVTAWPITTRITRVDFEPRDFRIEFTKHAGPDRWPDATTPKWDGPLQYTIFAIIKVDGQWRSTGCIQLWQSRPGVGGPFSNGAKDWWFRTDAMAGHQPAPGEQVGFFVAAGDCRLRTEPTSVLERSNIVLVAVPENDHGSFYFNEDLPAPPPLPEPLPLPLPLPTPNDFAGRVLALLTRIADAQEALLAAVRNPH